MKVRLALNVNPAMGRDFNPSNWRITRAQCEIVAGGVVTSRGEPVAGVLPAVRSARAHGTAFQLKVWQAVRRIPSGQTQTYGQLAKSIGCGSARAVGVALGANPLAGLIPCHRVVAADGLGGFAWGVDLKRAWLRAEADGAAR